MSQTEFATLDTDVSSNLEQDSEDPRSSKEARASRLRKVRSITRLSRQAFAQRYGVVASNFQNWEGPRYGGLTEQGAKRVIEALRAERVDCSLLWLMHGLGEGPQRIPDFNDTDSKEAVVAEKRGVINAAVEDQFVNEELRLFREHYVDTLDLVVRDDGMDPAYQRGDRVAGKRYYLDGIDQVVDMVCIVQTAVDASVMLRIVKKGAVDGLYTLVCLNPGTTVDRPILYDVKLVSAAPVLWQRRKSRC